MISIEWRPVKLRAIVKFANGAHITAELVSVRSGTNFAIFHGAQWTGFETRFANGSARTYSVAKTKCEALISKLAENMSVNNDNLP